MNKQEAIKKTEELERQLAELKAIIEAPDTSELVFRPEYNVKYKYIGCRGESRNADWYAEKLDIDLLEIGNCFRTEEDAKNSAKHYIMNSDYDYWFPWSGQPKPKVLPKGLEYWDERIGRFRASVVKKPSKIGNSFVYRWKRREQV